MKKRFTRDSEQKIQAIYIAFTELVNEIGYDKITIRQIAKRANISVGTIYHYFSEGKAAIAASLYQKNILETFDIKNLTGYKIDDLKQQIIRHLQLHKENMELYRAFDQAIYSHSDIFEDTKRRREEVLLEKSGDLEVHLLQGIMIIYATVDAIIHRHLFVESFFEFELELIEYLTMIAESASKFLL